MANGEAGSGVYWGKDEWRGESGYFDMLAGGYAELCKAVDDNAAGPPQRRNSRGWFGIGGGSSGAADGGPNSVLLIDAANGVGACKVRCTAIGPLRAALAAKDAQLECEVRNDGTGEDAALLNEACGAEHAQKARQPPAGFQAGKDNGKRCCSLDGDADRVVYHYFDNG
eukprot:1761-Heterococcus_DN1.PRE.1